MKIDLLKHRSEDCSIGYYGPNCSRPCRYPNYGEKCQKSCNCKKEYCTNDKGCVNTSGEYLQGKMNYLKTDAMYITFSQIYFF